VDSPETMASGIDIVGSVSWGTHLCLFYRTTEDLLDILVPYLKAGLENNEFCMWVTSDPLTIEDARAALSAAVPDLDARFESHQMEIVPYTEWYLKGGYFDMERVFSGWIGKLEDALAKGFEGLRATGNTAWLEENNWDDFVQYEEKLNNIIGDYRMMTICTYSLDICSAREVIEVCSNHQFALIRQAGTWELIESSELKKTEQALRESEKKYRLLVENLNEGIWAIDAEAITTFANEKMAETLGYRVEEMMGKSLYEFMDDRGKELAEYNFERRQQGVKEQHDFEFMRKDGSRLYASLETSPLTDSEGNFVGALAGVMDITERKRAEEVLRRAQFTVEHSADSMLWVTSEGKIIYANEEACRRRGYTREEMLSLEIFEINVDFADDPDTWEMVRDRLRESGHFTAEFRHRTKGGEVFPVDAALSFFEFEGGWLFVANVRDITDRRQAEEALRTSEERFRAVFENMSSGVAVYEAIDEGRDFLIRDFNKAGETIDDITREELLGRSLQECFPGAREFGLLEVLKRVWETGVPENFPIAFYQDNRTSGWRDNFVYKLPAGELVAIYDDVSEKKRAEEQMARSQEQLRALSTRLQEAREEERTRISREIHDELGQALTGLKMDLSWLRRSLPEGHPESYERIESMAGLIDSNIALVRQISSDLRPAVLDQLGLAAALEWLAQDFEKRTGIKCTFDTDVSERRFDENTSSTVFRVFQEALTNITRHAEATRVDVVLDEHDGMIVLEVKDNGKGISESEIGAAKSLGILGMKERAMAVGGEFDVIGVSGKGTVSRWPR